MEAWKIIIGVVVVLGLGLLCMFDRHCQEKFGYAFFSKRALTITTIAFVFLALGTVYLQPSNRSFQDTFAGAAILFGIGAAILGYLIYENFKATNFWYGFGGSFVQIPLLMFVATLVLALIIFWMARLIISVFPTESYEDHRRREEEELILWNSTDNEAGPNFQG